MSETLNIPQISYDELTDSYETLEGVECLLRHRYVELGSFEEAMRDIGIEMDWIVRAYADSGKPWFGPIEMLINVMDRYDTDPEDCP